MSFTSSYSAPYAQSAPQFCSPFAGQCGNQAAAQAYTPLLPVQSSGMYGTSMQNAVLQQGNSCEPANVFRYSCSTGPNGRVKSKIELTPSGIYSYTYQFDKKGHLQQVWLNGELVEEYKYNSNGQRIWQKLRSSILQKDIESHLEYNAEGQLVNAGITSFEYDYNKSLARKNEHLLAIDSFKTGFTYDNTRLLRVKLGRNNSTIDYVYNNDKNAPNPQGPVAKFCNGKVVASYEWHSLIHLKSCTDYTQKLHFDFDYDSAGKLCGVLIYDLSKRLPNHDGYKSVYASCLCDQIGSVRVLVTPNGSVLKNIRYDSFGNVLEDSCPDFHFPLGFAGGLADADTGLVRFGFRDYDPQVGRFTCPDPIGDTGGDHDLYDYCVDDPINGCDPSGLFPPLLLFLGAKALGLGIAAAGAYGSAAVADKIKSKRDKKDSSSAVDAMNKVAPIVAAISGASTVPGLMTMAPGAITAAGQRIGAALTTSQHGGKVIKTAQAIEGFVNPNAPTTLAVPGLVGTGAARAKSIYDEWRNQ